MFEEVKKTDNIKVQKELPHGEASGDPLFVLNELSQVVRFNFAFSRFAGHLFPDKPQHELPQLFIERISEYIAQETEGLYRLSTELDEVNQSDDFYLSVHKVTVDSGETISICQISSITDRDETAVDRNYKIASVINQLGRRLDKSYRLDETLKIILLGATAGQGLGFNRAFLLLYDPSHEVYNGEIAIGPSDGQEAAAIWSELDGLGKSLDELIEDYNSATQKCDVKVNEIVKRVSLPKKRMPESLKKVFDTKQPLLVTPSDEPNTQRDEFDLFSILGVDSVAVAPLTVEGDTVGLLLADNLITNRKINDADLEILGIFANHAGAALQRSRLYEELQDKVKQLARINIKLRESQKKLIESEKMNAVGKMAFHVAHEIRNPLSVVGGYARSMRRKSDMESPNNKPLDIIIKEVERIEEVLNNFSSISKVVPEDKKVLDLSAMVMEVLQMICNASPNMVVPINLEEAPTGIWIYGSEKQIRNVILTFLKQFLKDNVQCSPVQARVSATTGKAVLEFQYRIDPGIKSHAHYVFTNIYSSSHFKRDMDLVIADEIINRHSGLTEIEYDNNNILKVIIKLPLHKE
ncbi:MAG: GAF domain-containing protein [candidate division Zixibacteria bacterium]|nr:GAF domain-containing protein [candidate division Zixibacteria bacterium]